MANTFTNFQPTYWSDVAFFEYGKGAIAPQVTNLTWLDSGAGEAVRIPKFAYGETSGTHLDLVTALEDAPDNVSEATLLLNVDQEWGFHFQIKYTEQEKTNTRLGEGVFRQRARALGAKIDSQVFSRLTGATTTLTGAVVKTTLVSAIEDLNDANAPQDGRILLVNPAGYSDLLNAQEFTSADRINGAVVNVTGFVGRVLGLDVFLTNCLPSALDAAVMHRAALAMAMRRPIDTRIFDQPRHFSVGYSGRASWGSLLVDADLVVGITQS